MVTSALIVTENTMLSIGILGCGNIAGILAAHGAGIVEISACYDLDQPRMEAFAKRVGAKAYRDVESLLEQEYPVLVEAASIEAVQQNLPRALASGKDVVVLSVGALTDESFLQGIRHDALRLGKRVHVPSGAVFGLDNLKVARICSLDQLVLRTTKHPRALAIIDTSERQCVFRGKASAAVRRFPRNINVSAALGLAARVEPEVELWADPTVQSNRHEIEAVGEFGKVTICMENLPSPDNPATSYLAALSVLALLADLDDPIRVGT